MAAVKIFGEHDARTREQMARCMQHGSVVGGVLCHVVDEWTKDGGEVFAVVTP